MTTIFNLTVELFKGTAFGFIYYIIQQLRVLLMYMHYFTQEGKDL